MFLQERPPRAIEAQAPQSAGRPRRRRRAFQANPGAGTAFLRPIPAQKPQSQGDRGACAALRRPIPAQKPPSACDRGTGAAVRRPTQAQAPQSARD